MSQEKLDTEEILVELAKKIIGGNEVNNILNNPNEFPTELIENLSLTTALKYWKGEINYVEGDYIINNLYSFWLTKDYYLNYGFSEIAWECYEAFDAGEYFRSDDDRKIDPAEKYTKPLIEEILKRKNKI
ncbi:hypothetical protein EZ428_21215 [Pedobacter frigiditerrae]|uniref:Uncharacterized protein n=1 Tax=Pedobacter frigiditerrae TaxID=2530452 RepID=A0A4R0MNR9_9SPHI|nr:hypothetical protein [Pedobacter frigiditerrae]TCC88243.1 hypothetical protein EZ428_21215 [Pedobacter frigiditerrae]